VRLRRLDAPYALVTCHLSLPVDAGEPPASRRSDVGALVVACLLQRSMASWRPGRSAPAVPPASGRQRPCAQKPFLQRGTAGFARAVVPHVAERVCSPASSDLRISSSCGRPSSPWRASRTARGSHVCVAVLDGQFHQLRQGLLAGAPILPIALQRSGSPRIRLQQLRNLRQHLRSEATEHLPPICLCFDPVVHQQLRNGTYAVQRNVDAVQGVRRLVAIVVILVRGCRSAARPSLPSRPGSPARWRMLSCGREDGQQFRDEVLSPGTACST
jgi:hypothetical protein